MAYFSNRRIAATRKRRSRSPSRRCALRGGRGASGRRAHIAAARSLDVRELLLPGLGSYSQRKFTVFAEFELDASSGLSGVARPAAV